MSGLLLVHADPGAGLLPYACGQTVVIHVGVRDEDRADVADRVAGLGEPGLERLPCLLGAPTGVDDSDAVGRFEDVHEDIAQHARQRYGYRP